MNSVKYLLSYAPFLSGTSFVCFKTSEPQELGLEVLYVIIYSYIGITYLPMLLAPFSPRSPPPPKIFFQIKILCQNSFTKELKIRGVGFVLKSYLTFFQTLIVPHALHCIVAFLYFTSFDSLAYCFGFSTTPHPR